MVIYDMIHYVQRMTTIYHSLSCFLEIYSFIIYSFVRDLKQGTPQMMIYAMVRH